MIRNRIAAAALIALAATQAAAERLSLNEISAYLNSVTSAEASFTQINADGTIATGTLAIKRPGKVRFDYAPPEQSMVVASAGAVYVIDGKLRADPQTYPLSRTPLSIILAPRVDLARDGMVVDHSYDGSATTVTAQDPERPEYGTIRLRFTDAPVELRQWVIEDSSGGQTTVVLDALARKDLPDRMFWIDSVLDER